MMMIMLIIATATYWENLFFVRCVIFDVTILTTRKEQQARKIILKVPYIADEDIGARIG